ncbi:hypothetical protein BBK36DRAFT_1133604 [Trichoderma citrinoviride]|uniref:Uncharacterized protein n=1 Tax=Trichoderma citrinoviride TaxID=58853 RepID=A0A2T4B530_9HYPO|nr:hypothetical protein BBK36DRAFT_1133604 [Trichoderma citrinoviride]PTB64443.1 hypothetical protein BBK36DRAFT_1133604 [Trichoderma citrinoviride]
MGGSSKKNRRKNPADDNEVDLLTLAFNIPTRRDFERAEREVAQEEIHTQGVRVQYDAGEDESSLLSQPDITRSDTPDADETPKARKLFKPRHQLHAKEHAAAVQASSPNDHLKPADQEPPPMRRASRRESKSSKARERASSSPASFRAPSPAFAIPASATFPRAVPNYAQQGASFAAPDASTRPLHPSIGGYQPVFAYPAVSVYPPPPQYYSPVPSDPVAGGHQYAPFPMTPKPAANAHATPQPSGLVSQQVQDIQSKLDEVIMKLSQHPEDVALKSTLSTLQTKLNTKLNSLLGMETRKESEASDVPTTHDSKSTPAQPQAAAQQDKSHKRTIRHHLCTGCGNVRSPDYHNKHPLIPGGNPSMNYCEDCFEEKVENGDSKYHFCYGCGAARSKEFHRNHPISRGDTPFPNYCSVCIEEVRSAETIADVSMVNFNPGSRPNKNGASHYGAARDQAQGSKFINAFGPTQEMSDQEDQPDVLLFSAHSETSEQVHPREKKKIPQPLKLSTSGPQLSPSNSSPDSPYYPVRHAGTTQRRAQRSPLTSPGSQYCSSPDTPPTPKYQPPYVEDVVSPTQETKLPFGETQTDPTTPGKQYSQENRAHHSTKAAKPGSPQETSDGSTEGQTFTDDSAHSIGSKSVKFRPKVDIRFSDSRTSSNASSHAQVVEEDIKPDEDTIPSRVGIYGTSPVKSSGGYYSRHQTSHGVPSSVAAEDEANETIPERSYRGAFSKDSPAASWLPPTSNAGNYWYSTPSAYHSPTSPSTESFTGYRPGARSTFNYGSGGIGMGATGVPPPLHTTRSSPGQPSTKEGSESQKSPKSPNSGPQHQTFAGSPGNGWSYSYSSSYGGGQADESTFRKPSPWSTFSSWYDPECHTMREDSSYSQDYSDYSQPSSNPYYQPRKRSFPDLSSYCSFGTQPRRTPGKWAKEYKSTTTKAPRPTPYWIPEPIIEEPDSPDSSPAKKPSMIEFNIEISPKSTSNTATSSSPDSVEDDLDRIAGSETDGDSDEENDLSNSSLDTPSLD